MDRTSYKRGLSAVAYGDSEEAARWFALSIDAVPPFEHAIPRLVSLLTEQQKYTDLAHLAQHFGKSRALDEKTVLLLVKGTAQTGDIKLATQVLEGAMTWQPPTAEMYSTLAGFYRASGNNVRADEPEARARTL